MISRAHVMIFTKDEDADRAFLRGALGIPCASRRTEDCIGGGLAADRTHAGTCG